MLHGRLDLPELARLYTEFDDMPVVSISGAQREPLPAACWVATVHHGLPFDLYAPRESSGDYFAFLGRVSPEKGLADAIEVANRLRVRLNVAAKIDQADREYFEKTIAPLFENPYVNFIGEIGEGEKEEFLGGAKALLAPIDWPEPFGLVIIEALACGTPVIGFNRGSLPELIDHGETGFIVQNVDEAVEAANWLPDISRRACREAFEQRFTAQRMASNYLTVYAGVLARGAADGAVMVAAK
jgi:glycosyltransferase involved in cell wall biosynthesis